jgi:hypothetical protein
MERKHFPLDPKDNPRFVRISQIIFGILCIIIGLYWAIFQTGSLKADPTLWITVVFLTGFGVYQIAAGFGKTSKFIDFEADKIVLKHSSFLPEAELKSSYIEKIDIFPLSICFLSKDKKKKILRFGLNNTGIIVPVKDAVVQFADLNNIAIEEKKEEI